MAPWPSFIGTQPYFFSSVLSRLLLPWDHSRGITGSSDLWSPRSKIFNTSCFTIKHCCPVLSTLKSWNRGLLAGQLWGRNGCSHFTDGRREVHQGECLASSSKASYTRLRRGPEYLTSSPRCIVTAGHRPSPRSMSQAGAAALESVAQDSSLPALWGLSHHTGAGRG